jgi:hypothetical protein
MSSVNHHNKHHRHYKDTIDDYHGDTSQDQRALEPLRAPPDFRGPTEERYCTDVLCLFFLVLAWAVMTSLGVYALHNGDYRLVLYPLDYQGNVCGAPPLDDQMADMTDYPYLLYVNYYTGGVCVNQCPQLTGLVQDNLTDMQTLVTYAGIFQADSAQLSFEWAAEWVSPHYSNYDVSDNNNETLALASPLNCTVETCFGNNATDPLQSWTSQGVNEGYGYAYYVGDTYQFFHRCYLTQQVSFQNKRIMDTTTTQQ